MNPLDLIITVYWCLVAFFGMIALERSVILILLQLGYLH